MNKLILPLLLLISFSAYADMSTNNGRIQPNKNNSSGFKSDGRTYTSNSKQSTYLKSSTTGARSNRPVNVTVQNQVAKRTVMSNVFQNAKKRLNFKNVGSGLLRRTPNLIAYGLVAYDICLKSKKCKSMVIDEIEDFFDTENTEGTYIIFLTNDPAGFNAARDYTYQQFKDWCAKNSRTCDIKGVLPDTSRKNLSSALINVCIGAAHLNVKSMSSLPDNIQPTNGRNSSGFCDYNGYYQSSIGSQAALIIDYVPLTESRFIEIAKDEADEDPDGFIRASKDEDGNVPGMSKPIVIDVDVEIVISNPYTDPNDGKPKQTKWEFEKDEKGEVRVKETHEARPDLLPDSPQAPKVKLDIDIEDKNNKKEQDNQEKDNNGVDQIQIKLGDIQDDDPFSIPQITNPTAWQPDNFLPTSATCPAPKTTVIMGKTYEFTYDWLCQFAEQIKYLMIAIASIMAGYIVLGRKE